MKKIYQLKTILNIVIVFSMVIMTVSVLGLLYGLVSGNMTKMNITVLGKKPDAIDAAFVVVAVLVAVGYSLFIYAIYLLNKLVDLFIRREFFTDVVVKTLRLIGLMMLASAILLQFPAYVYGVLNSASINITMKTISPESIVFSVIISLFFIILSYIFNEAKMMKDESELTI